MGSAIVVGLGFAGADQRVALADEPPREIDNLRVTQNDMGDCSAAITEDVALWMWGTAAAISLGTALGTTGQ